ncbi:MAG: hypothetical protein WBN40_11435 [Pseudomonadales bacterium]
MRTTILSVEDGRDMILHDLFKTDEGYVWRHDRRLHTASAMRMTTAHIETMLQALRTPTLVVGAEEGMLANRDLPEAVKNNPCIEVLRHPGSHHMHVAREHAASIAAILNEWWTKR